MYKTKNLWGWYLTVKIVNAIWHQIQVTCQVNRWLLHQVIWQFLPLNISSVGYIVWAIPHFSIIIIFPWVTITCFTVNVKYYQLNLHEGSMESKNKNFDLWPLSSKINRVHPLTMANMYTKFDQEAHNGLVSIMFISLFPYVSGDLDLWLLSSKMNKVHLLIMVNISVKFDIEIHNS